MLVWFPDEYSTEVIRLMSRSSTGPWVGALLRQTWQGVRAHIDEAVRRAGYEDIGRAHIALFRHPTLDRMRPSELAQELRVSKQAVNDLLRDLERAGYLRREVDPEDRRGRLIRLTDKGIELEDIIRIAARDAEVRLERELGRARLRTLRSALIDAAAVLNNRGS